MSLFKIKPVKSQAYLDYVKSLPSCISGRPSDDAHHIKGRGYGGTSKCSDLFTIPLTREEHTILHNMGWQSWEAEFGSQLHYCLKTIEQAVRDGMIEL